ncbi:MAG: (d)CMP kinase [Phycisphaerae bacterium]|nr:(d)CMP kinase [Tepidisphaeraceae bacterium]
MVITIDGPAGTGKSTVSREVARRLGFDFLDTGAMYRAIGLAVIRRGTAFDDVRGMEYVAAHCRIEFDWTRQPPGVLLNGEPVGHLLRGTEATDAAKHVAQVPAIRHKLVDEQRRIGAEHGNLVTEGRDQGSVVFPDAPFKFYLTATARERAHRRARELRARGEIVDENEILRSIEERDQKDRSRSVGPLAIPDGADVVDTTTLTQEQVVERIVDKVRAATPSLQRT